MSTRERFLSLDVFRGMTIFLMILVNTPGPGAATYPILVHAKWFGLTAADLVYPSFLFAVGNAMSFAMQAGVSDADYRQRVLRRTGMIFLLGVLMYWFPFFKITDTGWHMIPFAETRIPGVLQRIAICFGVTAMLVRKLSVRQLVAVAIAILPLYWVILLVFGQSDAELTKAGNAGTRLDLALIGQSHLYRKDGGFDPEGLLGCLPAVVNVIAGYLTGRYLQSAGKKPRTLAWMAGVGLLMIVLGAAWNPWFPVAKKLWTSSYVLVTVGFDLVLLSALVGWIEVLGHRAGSNFFNILGKNPLVIYLFSELFVVVLRMIPVGDGMDVYSWFGIRIFQSIAPGALGTVLCGIAYTMVCWTLGYVMDKRRIYVKL